MNVLVLNAGSSTLTFQVVRTDEERIASDSDERIAQGVIDRIGGEALVHMEAVGKAAQKTATPILDHRAA